MSDTTPTEGGIGLVGATFLVLLACKLTGNIDWSWLWVTSPLWMTPAVIVGLLLVYGVVIGLVSVVVFATERFQRKDEK